MRFNSLEYIILLTTTVILFFNLPRNARLVLLIAASIVFYAFWNIPLVGLIVISAVVDYSAGRWIVRCRQAWQRKAFVVLSVLVNLGLLGYFKYSNFFMENIHSLLGLESERTYLDILLPPGISFYTFQTMSYTIDVYRGKITPTQSFLRFFLYVSFFPQLVAGPIERAAHLLTQFGHAATSRMSTSNLVVGCRMMIWGMFKKVVIADWCAQLVDRVYGNPGGYDGWSALIATYAFTLQIYCDFSAYSEIARGSARLFGIDLMQNFDQPYLTTDIAAFWRRWHISLSTWIRDYLYIPLGGSRCGKMRVLRNLIITMFLSGLWHGAAWNFVIWGLYHGVLLLLGALLARNAVWGELKAKTGVAGKLFNWFVTLHLVVFSWILFRVETIQDVPVILGSISQVWLSMTPPTSAQGLFLLFVGLFMLGSYLSRRYRLFERIDGDAALSLVFYGSLLVLLLLFGKPDGPQFIYFQF